MVRHVAGRRALLSGIPYASYQRMDVGDLRDLFAYLKSLPAVAARARPRPAVPVQYPAHARPAGSSFLDGMPFQPNRRNRRNGTAAPIW